MIYRGNKELQTTIVEPSGPMVEEAFKDIDNGLESANNESESKTDAKDELYLGHISESHYVSLRPKGWRDKLFQGNFCFKGP